MVLISPSSERKSTCAESPFRWHAALSHSLTSLTHFSQPTQKVLRSAPAVNFQSFDLPLTSDLPYHKQEGLTAPSSPDSARVRHAQLHPLLLFREASSVRVARRGEKQCMRGFERLLLDGNDAAAGGGVLGR